MKGIYAIVLALWLFVGGYRHLATLPAKIKPARAMFAGRNPVRSDARKRKRQRARWREKHLARKRLKRETMSLTLDDFMSFPRVTMRHHRSNSRQRGLRRRQLRKQQRGLCYYCERPLTTAFSDGQQATLDHKVAIALGGTNDFSNLVACCARCNLFKDISSDDEVAEISLVFQLPIVVLVDLWWKLGIDSR